MKIIYYTLNYDLCMSTFINLNDDVYAKKIFNIGLLKVFDLKMALKQNVFAHVFKRSEYFKRYFSYCDFIQN